MHIIFPKVGQIDKFTKKGVIEEKMNVSPAFYKLLWSKVNIYGIIKQRKTKETFEYLNGLGFSAFE